MTVPVLGGAPAKYNSPEEMQGAIDKYFASCWREDWREEYNKESNAKEWVQKFDHEGKPMMVLNEQPTITGLALALGFASRQALLNYEAKKEYYDTIKKAKTMVEQCVEEGMLNGKVSTIGAIFNLKNNFGWVDKIDIATTSQPEQLTPSDIRSQIEQRKKSSELDEPQE